MYLLHAVHTVSLVVTTFFLPHLFYSSFYLSYLFLFLVSRPILFFYFLQHLLPPLLLHVAIMNNSCLILKHRLWHSEKCNNLWRITSIVVGSVPSKPGLSGSKVCNLFVRMFLKDHEPCFILCTFFKRHIAYFRHSCNTLLLLTHIYSQLSPSN